jgi:hypothetical protein
MGVAWTYTLPVIIGHVTVLQREFDFLLVLCRELIVAIDHVCVASRGLDEIVDLCRCDAAPWEINTGHQPFEISVPK